MLNSVINPKLMVRISHAPAAPASGSYRRLMKDTEDYQKL